MRPNMRHQSICFGLNLIDILILALKMCQALIKLDFESRRKRKYEAPPRIRKLVDAIVHALLAAIDGHHPAKASVLERIQDIIECIEVTSPMNLVTLCQRIFEQEPELCRKACHGQG